MDEGPLIQPTRMEPTTTPRDGFDAGYGRRVNLNMGKMRDVLVSYAANPGRNSTRRPQSWSRSSPVTSAASTGKVAVPPRP